MDNLHSILNVLLVFVQLASVLLQASQANQLNGKIWMIS